MAEPPAGYGSQQYFSLTPPPGLTELLGKLEHPGQELNDAARQILERILTVVRAYPPPRPSYQRTMKLQNSWHIPATGIRGDELGIVRSGGPEYNIRVKDEDWQADVHRGRHRTTADVAEDKAIEQFALELLDQAYQRMFNQVK